MMNQTPDRWTTHDLEQYHDGELDAHAAESLSAALREDPALRERLSGVAHRDALARVALAHAPPPRRAGRALWLATGALAAALLALVGVLAAPMWQSPGEVVVIAGSGDDSDIRDTPTIIVFSLPVANRVGDARESPVGPPPEIAALPERPPPAQAAPDFIRRLDIALARGEAGDASRLLSEADPDLRAAGYRRLGEVLRSVDTTRRVLQELPPEARLAACRELVLEPRWRTLSCSQLTTLRTDPEMRPAVDAFLDELARSPDNAWLAARIRGMERAM